MVITARSKLRKVLFLALSVTFWRPFVKRFTLCYQTCLSVTLVYCGQTVGWIKMKLDMQVGLNGHIVLDLSLIHI